MYQNHLICLLFPMLLNDILNNYYEYLSGIVKKMYLCKKLIKSKYLNKI